MNKNILLCAMVIILNCVEVSLYADSENVSSKINEVSKFSLYPISQAVLNTSIKAGAAGALFASQYISNTYLVQEEHLVKTKYPHAQAWYDAMHKKYPNAHLNSKLFLQTMRGYSAKLMSWRSTINQIYFPQDALKDIDTLYKKHINDIDPLTEDENLFLSMQEFVLLHEAGHIEHNHITNGIVISICLFASVEALRAVYRMHHDRNNLRVFFNALESQNNLDSDTALVGKLGYDFFLCGLVWIGTFTIDAIMPFIVSRPQELEADKFAYQNADMQALQGGIKFFENADIDPLFNINDKQLSPFIKTESTVGNIAQNITSCFEAPFFYIDKNFKQMIASTYVTRWIYDYNRKSSQPGPSVRAQILKDEVARRKNSK